MDEHHDELGLAFASGCVVVGDLDGVEFDDAFGVIHYADGSARALSRDDCETEVARCHRNATLYPPDSEEAKSWTELADRLEAEIRDGMLNPDTVQDVWGQRLEQGPLTDAVLGSQAVSVQTLGRVAPLRPPRTLLAPSRRYRQQRLARTTPRRRERRTTGRRLTRAGPARPRPSADDDPEVARRAEVRR